MYELQLKKGKENHEIEGQKSSLEEMGLLEGETRIGGFILGAPYFVNGAIISITLFVCCVSVSKTATRVSVKEHPPINQDSEILNKPKPKMELEAETISEERIDFQKAKGCGLLIRETKRRGFREAKNSELRLSTPSPTVPPVPPDGHCHNIDVSHLRQEPKPPDLHVMKFATSEIVLDGIHCGACGIGSM